MTCANSQTSWAVCLQGLGATPHFSRQVSVGVEEEGSLDCWAETKRHGQANEVPRVIQERARGLVKGGRAGTKSKHNPFIMLPGPVLTQQYLGAVEETSALGSWEAL